MASAGQCIYLSKTVAVLYTLCGVLSYLPPPQNSLMVDTALVIIACLSLGTLPVHSAGFMNIFNMQDL